MTDEKASSSTSSGSDEHQDDKPLSAAARRALAEAQARREAADAARIERSREINGRNGPEPVRYGDWEVKGLAVDF